MKILLVSPLPPPVGGISTWTTLFAEYCKQQGDELCIVNTALIGKRSEMNDNTIHLGEELHRSFTILYKVWKNTKSFSPDVVYINTSCSFTGLIRDALAMMLAGRNKIIVHCHCDVETQINHSTGANCLLKYMMKKASRVFALNKHSENYLDKLVPGKTEIVPNFVQDNYGNCEYKVREELKTAVYVGHVLKTKGIYEILAAAKHLPVLQFKVVGPLMENMENCTVPQNVHMLGMKTADEVKKELLAADVFLFPTYTEGFSMALLEAMVTGLPVITTDVGANRDMIEDKGGIIIPVGESHPILEAIEALEPAEVRSVMSNWNKKKARDTYMRSKVMQNIFEKIEEAIK